MRDLESNLPELPTQWKAAVLRCPGEPLEIVEVKRPQLAFGQVLIRLNYSGVCRSQLMETRGLRGVDAWLPHLLGHEGVGYVCEIGAGVSKVKPGDEVIAGWIRAGGIESEAPSLETTNGEMINAGRVTTFSEYTVVSENRLYLKPPDLLERPAILFGCALLTGAGMVLNEAKPAPGSSVLILGLGGVGMAALIASLAAGARVFTVDPSEEKREHSLRLGAEVAFDPSQGDLVQQVHHIVPDGVMLALEASGTTQAIEEAFRCVSFHGGKLLFASHPPSGELISLDPHHLLAGRRIAGSWGGSARPDVDIPNLVTKITEARIDLDFMVPDTYRLSQVNEALGDLETGVAMRPVLDMREIDS